MHREQFGERNAQKRHRIQPLIAEVYENTFIGLSHTSNSDNNKYSQTEFVGS